MNTPTLIFTDAAARKVHELILEENNPLLNLRVYITGGGCSGFQYGFEVTMRMVLRPLVNEKTDARHGWLAGDFVDPFYLYKSL